MKRIFICSRYAGDTARNEAVAERLCRKAVEAGHRSEEHTSELQSH